MRSLMLGLTFASLAAAASAQAPPVTVDNPQVRASLGNVPTAAAYGTVRSRAADRLVGVSCTCAGAVTLHQTVHTNGVARMVRETAVPIPAGGSVAFAPGGRHIMLTGLKAPIRAGQKVTLTLRFEKAGAVPVVFTATDTPGAAAEDHSHHVH